MPNPSTNSSNPTDSYDNSHEEIDNIVEGLRNPFINNMTRNTRKSIEEYLEHTMPGKWDEWNVRMAKREFDREDHIMRDIENRSDV